MSCSWRSTLSIYLDKMGWNEIGRGREGGSWLVFLEAIYGLVARFD